MNVRIKHNPNEWRMSNSCPASLILSYISRIVYISVRGDQAGTRYNSNVQFDYHFNVLHLNYSSSDCGPGQYMEFSFGCFFS